MSRSGIRRRKSQKAQSATEYILTYGWAILVVAIIAVVLYLFVFSPSRLTPSKCTFINGVYCQELVIGSNTVTQSSTAGIFLTNTRPYAISSPSIQLSINNKTLNGGACTPGFALSGGAIICTITIPQTVITNDTVVSGSLYLTAIPCPSGNPATCTNGQKETYTGTFTTRGIGTLSPISNTISLTVSDPNPPANGNPDKLTATVTLLGTPLAGATVSFSQSANFATIGPSAVTTGFNGNAISYISGLNPGTTQVTASFGGINSFVVVNFFTPIAVSVALSSQAGPICTYQNSGQQAVTVDSSTNYECSQIPLQFSYPAGDSHTYTFSPTILGGTGTQYIFQSASGCGATTPSGTLAITVPSNSCAITASYTAQYLLTEIPSPCAATSGLSPVNGCPSGTAWYNYGTPVTLGIGTVQSGYSFQSWASSDSGGYSGASTSPSITMSNPITEQANFVPISGAPYLYCVGEIPGSEREVYYAPISSTGIGTWTPTSYPSNSYPVMINDGSCSTYNNYIYCVGTEGTASMNEVYYAPLSNSGIGTWTSSTKYPIAIGEAGCSSYNGYIYCLGTGDTSPYNQVYYAPVSSSGIGSWTPTNMYPVGLDEGTCSVYNGYVYCLSGHYSPQSKSTYYAALSTNGISTWTSTTSYPIAFSDAGCVPYNGYIYCVGTSRAPLLYVPLTLTNSQTSATPAPFQQMLTVNSLSYSSYINSDWKNVEFTTGPAATGSVFQAWVESNAINTATNTIVWVNIPGGLPVGSTTIYMDMMSSNVMSASGPTGEAPQLSASYGQYDNGASVFITYQNFVGTSTPSDWTLTGPTSNQIVVNNGVHVSGLSQNSIVSSTPYTYGNVLDFYGKTLGSSSKGDYDMLAGYIDLVTPYGYTDELGAFWGLDGIGSGLIPAFGGIRLVSEGAGIASTTWHVFSTYWSSSTLGKFNLDYGATNTLSVAPANAITKSLPIGIGIQNCAGTCAPPVGATIYWFRQRANPPSGVMPGVSFGTSSYTPSYNQVYYAPISSTGIGTWTSTTSYPIGMNDAGCSAYNNYIYCVGSGNYRYYGSSSNSLQTYYAPISSTGIGTWTSTQQYPVKMEGAYCVVPGSGGGYLTGGGPSSGPWPANVITAINVGLGAPTIIPPSPSSNAAFTISCPTNAPGPSNNYDCIDAYPNGLSSTACSWNQWSGYNALFSCSGMSAGSYNAVCTASTGTARNCAAANTNTIYSVQQSMITYFYESGLPMGTAWSATYNGVTNTSASFAWNPTTSYPFATTDTYCSNYNNYVYCVGGSKTAGSVVNNVYYAPISSTGIGTWTSSSSYPTPVDDHDCETSGGYIYCVGGWNEVGAPYGLNSVYYAAISSSGVGTWSSTISYPIALSESACSISSGYIYCVAGWGSSGAAINNAYYAAVSSTGVGTWTSTSHYPIAVSELSCTTYNNYIYCAAGDDEISAVVNNVYYAPISSTGIGTWLTTNSYPISLADESCTSSSGYVYCVAGANTEATPATPLNLVYYAPVLASGALGAWSSASPYPLSVNDHVCNFYNNYVYCLGGATTSGFVSSAYYAPINGNVISFSTAPGTYSYQVPNQAASGVTYTSNPSSGSLTAGNNQLVSFSPSAVCTSNACIYCVGTQGSGSSPYQQVYYAPISTSGIGAWASTTSYPVSMEDAGCSIYNGYIYCVGTSGTASQKEVYYAPISTTGIGTWTSTTSYPIAFSVAGCSISSSGYIYCVGTNTAAPYKQVYYSPVSSTGIGTWTSTTSYPVAINCAGCSIYNNDIYCVGTTATAPGTQVYYAPISTTGVGTWVSSTTYPVSAGDAGCVPYNGYIYCFSTGVSPYNLVYYAPISSTGIGTWTSTTSFPYPMYDMGCSINNGYAYCVGTQASPSRQVYYAAVSSSGVGAWSATTSYPIAMDFAWCEIPGSGGGYDSGGGALVTTTTTTTTSTIQTCTGNACLYCIGTNAIAPYNQVYYAPVSSSGVGSWAPSTNYPAPMFYAGCSISNGYIYCVGTRNTAAQQAVYYAPISSTGVGTWTSTTNYPVPMSFHGCPIAGRKYLLLRRRVQRRN